MRRPRTGFTLVELLVVISIIAVLASLMLVGINAFRRSSQNATCLNNLGQLGKGCLDHYTNRGNFPTGGWGRMWAGDPDLGFKSGQPGGWLFNVLPHVGQDEIRDLGKDMAVGSSERNAAMLDRVARKVDIFMCPARGRPGTVPYASSKPYVNVQSVTQVARTDYAGNGGDRPCPGTACWEGPASLTTARSMTNDQWQATFQLTATATVPKPYPTGVIYMRSDVKEIPDGQVCTYLLGEKYMDINRYEEQPVNEGVEQGWDVGYDTSVIRWTDNSLTGAPRQDAVSQSVNNKSFGSAHTSTWNAVFCDGHTAAISYDIEPETHRLLGNRNDGKPTDVNKL